MQNDSANQNDPAENNMGSEKYVSEQELNAKAVAPRVTLDEIEGNISSELYFTGYEGVLGNRLDKYTGETNKPEGPIPNELKLLTLCVMTLTNGFIIVGISACASAENYDEEIGRRVARGDAVRQIWKFLGFALREKLHRMNQLSSRDDRLGEALTKMTAFGLGNKDMFDIGDADAILTYFLNSDKQEEGGDTFASKAIKEGVEARPDPAIDYNYTLQEPAPQVFNELGPVDIDADNGGRTASAGFSEEETTA